MKYLSFFILFNLGFIKLFAQTDYSVFDTDKILINGKLPAFTSKKKLLKYLGDSVKKENFQPECGYFDQEEFYDVKFSIYSKNGISYMVYKDTADLLEIDLRKVNLVQFGKLKVDKNTTLENLKNNFKKSYTDFIKEFNQNKKDKEYFFRLSPCKVCDDQIQIILDKKLKVKSIVYWSPC